MADPSTSTSNGPPHLKLSLFRPSLHYPTHPYAAMLAQTAERYPEQVALLFKDVNLTYRELQALVNSFANALLAIGVKAGECVCLLMTNRPEYVISWFAITSIGAVASPMNPSYKEREVAYQLSNSEAVPAPDPHLLGDFAVLGDVTLGAVAEIYGVSVDADNAARTLADYFDIHLDHAPRVGATLPLDSIVLVARSIGGSRVSVVGLRLPEDEDDAPKPPATRVSVAKRRLVRAWLSLTKPENKV